jgi:SH3-like domain-containing protein
MHTFPHPRRCSNGAARRHAPRPWVGALIITLTLAHLPPVVSSADAQSVTPCNATAYLNDPDPKGTNVRRAANGKSTTLKRLTDGDTEIDITGSSGDWLRIKQARAAEGTVSFSGEGWVYAPLVAVRARGRATLRATDHKTSASVATIKDDEQLSVVACRGEWMRVKHNAVTGWIEKSQRCGNPVTTCV